MKNIYDLFIRKVKFIDWESSFNRYPISDIIKIQQMSSKEIEKIKMNMFIVLLNTKVFNIESGVNSLLLKTDNNLSKRNLPFNNFFINVVLPYNDKYIYGIWVTDPTDNYCAAEFIYDDVLNHVNLWETKKHIDKYDFIRTYVCNFLDFLNNPEIELVTVERTKEQNEKRIKIGKYPIPPNLFVRVTGQLKIYIDELHNRTDFHYSHRFWVRGHFRTLRSEKWGESRGKKIWILPYIKGKGILINKEYEVE